MSDHNRSRGDRELAWLIVGRNDEGAFRKLYDRHTPRLLRFAMRLVGRAGQAVAEDVVQETWLRAIQHRNEFRARSSLGTWLHGIALNVCREMWRADGRAPPVTDADGAEPTNIDARIDLEQALTQLPRGRRTVLVLHDLYGYKHRDIARMLDITEGTSKSQLTDARRTLESLLTGGESHAR